MTSYDGSGWSKVVSASIGSTITALAVTPLEVVKVRQQAASSDPTRTSTTNSVITKSPSRLPKNVQPCPRGCGTFVLSTGLGEYLTPKNKCRYFDPKTGVLRQHQDITSSKGTLRMLRSIFMKEGLSGIYAGLAPTLVMGIPNTIIYFYSYEELAATLRHRYPAEPTVPAVAGASARFVASLSTAPFELLRTQQAARVGSFHGSSSSSTGMIHEFRSMIRADGVYSLFRGVWPTLLRDVPFSAIYWVCIESMRDVWRSRRGDDVPSTWEQAGQALINGSVSGTIAACCTTPLDVLKTRSQVGMATATATAKANMEHAAAVEAAAVCDHGGAFAYRSPSSTTTITKIRSPASESTLQMARSIVHEEGIQGLWRGNVARMMKVAPACAIMISSYEIGKRVLD
jgi:solute carrier family 25 protein 39/40